MILSEKVEELYGNFVDEVYCPNALDAKTKEIIALAASVMADCVPCIEHHCGRALANGATREEIAEAFAISISIGSGNKKAKYSALIDNLTQKR